MAETSGQTREERLQEFVDWGAAHITGDEKGEAQTFIERLFIAFGQKGARDVGGTFEERIKQLFDETKKTSFADYVWKPIVLIEMKKRGADLAKHRQQAFDYWTHIAPGRPKYVVLCNFDEFWVYDFNTQLYSPKDKVKLTELAQSWGPLAFLFPTNEAPTFGNDREKVTRQAADKLAECFKKLIARKVDRALAQRFILQSMIAMFAEDIGLLPRYFFTNLVEECKQPRDSYDLLGGLFEAMNSKDSPTGGRYKGVRYFNGGIFSQPARIELTEDELLQLRGSSGTLLGATQYNWSQVEPEIFGAIFQDSMEKGARHAFGAHFTSADDIMKIVKPTISNPWDAAINGAKSAKRLNELLERLATLRVLDPACGSGNFLYLAYREMKDREAVIRGRLTKEFPEFPPTFAHVNARQFYGMDINPFAIELAKITLMIARKLAINELHLVGEPDLPLDNLDANFHVGDALITTAENGSAIQTPWPKVDVIIGNPPFLDARKITMEHGEVYGKTLERLYPEIARRSDYCVYWIRRAADHLPTPTSGDSFIGRAGLVGTQNIRNNESREGGLDHVVASGTILEAVDNQPWSGEANVHVSIVDWIKSQDNRVLPDRRVIWSKVAPSIAVKHRGKRGERADKRYQLVASVVPFINAALSSATDVTQAFVLATNREPKRCFEGQQPGSDGFRITADIYRKLSATAGADEILHPYLNGTDLLARRGEAWEYIIDFGKRTILEAQRFPKILEIVRQQVLPKWSENAAEERRKSGKETGEHQRRLESWWQLKRQRSELIACVELRRRFIACSRVTKRPIFEFISSDVRPDSSLTCFCFDDDYSFGLLQSNAHWQWFVTKCSKLKSDFRYTPESVFDTFPWPQSPTKKQVDAVAEAGREVRRVREEALKVVSGGLRAVYRMLELPGRHPLKDAHAGLDAAVMGAYGFDGKKDLLGQLLELNQQVAAKEKAAKEKAAKEKAGEGVTAPGVPGSYGDGRGLVSGDCVRA